MDENLLFKSSPFFDAVITFDDTNERKPSEKPFKEIFKVTKPTTQGDHYDWRLARERCRRC